MRLQSIFRDKLCWWFLCLETKYWFKSYWQSSFKSMTRIWWKWKSICDGDESRNSGDILIYRATIMVLVGWLATCHIWGAVTIIFKWKIFQVAIRQQYMSPYLKMTEQLLLQFVNCISILHTVSGKLKRWSAVQLVLLFLYLFTRAKGDVRSTTAPKDSTATRDHPPRHGHGFLVQLSAYWHHPGIQ